jgi:hypothetical protein
VSTPEQVLRRRNERMQATQPGIRKQMRSIPDAELIACLVANGQPRYAAEEVRTNPQVRFSATMFFCDVLDAAQGDKRAKQQVDFIREQWSRMRKEELITDDPTRGHTDLIDPRTLL